MDNVTIRAARVDDLETLLAFEQAMIGAERPFDSTIRSGTNVHYYDLERLIISPDSHLVVAEVDSKIIGSGYARIEESKPYLNHGRHSYLGFMYVVEEHRGKGVVSEIISALENWSRSKGVTEMQLEVYSENVPARRAYERSGYNASIVTMRKQLSDD